MISIRPDRPTAYHDDYGIGADVVAELQEGARLLLDADDALVLSVEMIAATDGQGPTLTRRASDTALVTAARILLAEVAERSLLTELAEDYAEQHEDRLPRVVAELSAAIRPPAPAPLVHAPSSQGGLQSLIGGAGR